ncbi:late embryogenesis abundant protein At5g17165-like isoform X2 [Populus nigra]|uniref:late embryogenesis abundant protein At5g17165-like isoform X2 n=1 Tax=Populus nigra TaxID=3691 RepID=UPI002B279D46|nr:late embryogenesis abundant protein At5g17165-like isoform X2 [Populus nigra]
MAANFKNTGILGKRVVNQIWTPNSTRSFSVSNTPSLRGAHTSVYDKNLDDELRPNVVPDDVIKPQSDKYWAPHPRTGVFGPATEQHLSEISGGDSASAGDGGQDPVLEEKAWFRPTSLEDLEKPHRLN